MKNNNNRLGDSTKRLQIDRKMIGILSVFTFLGICLVITIIVATNTLTGLIGFSSMQTHWTEARKEGTQHLISYIRTEDEKHLARFDKAMATIDSARYIRTRLAAKDSDHPSIRTKFNDLHILPQDVDNMITVFERFHNFADFKRSISQWAASDSILKKMESLADSIGTRVVTSSFSNADKKKALDRVEELDRKLTQKEYEITESLSHGVAYLKKIVWGISISLGLILLITGGFLTIRFLKSLKKWHRTIEIREQEYRSLFEENPNAVYSFSTEGEFVQGNQALENMIGYSIDELRGRTFKEFLNPSEVERVEAYFQKAVNGMPQTYETVGVTKDSNNIYLEITNLPIYVNNEITGVYGIAQDITDRKEKKEKIKEQLEEKTHLLSEVHDRVKNNLALVSGLINLQRDMVREEEENTYLDNIASRIHSMAMVHERLYQTENFSRLRIDKYISEFCSNIDNMVSDGNPDSEIVLNVDPVNLNIKQAIPLALLLNELITNAYKYGGSPDNNITVSLEEHQNLVTICVKDRGTGLPEEYDLERPNSLGLRLIKVLINQLDASCELNRKGGTTYTIQFENLTGS